MKREDLFIVSKLWNIFHQPDQVQRALDLSLKELDLGTFSEGLFLFVLRWRHRANCVLKTIHLKTDIRLYRLVSDALSSWIQEY